MDNMRIYNAVREVPPEAQKPIIGGRLKGMTDINPMWRLKRLTELFGPCGLGWRYDITHREFVPGANGEIACIVDIGLQVKEDGEWGDVIPGTGGAMYVSQERSSLHTDDEAPKKALTDALSVACKALGIGADVYFAKDRTKYDNDDTQAQSTAQTPQAAAEPKPSQNAAQTTQTADDLPQYAAAGQIQYITGHATPEQIAQLCAKYGVQVLEELSFERASRIVEQLQRRAQNRGRA